jgi:hypothetical protein
MVDETISEEIVANIFIIIVDYLANIIQFIQLFKKI